MFQTDKTNNSTPQQLRIVLLQWTNHDTNDCRKSGLENYLELHVIIPVYLILSMNQWFMMDLLVESITWWRLINSLRQVKERR